MNKYDARILREFIGQYVWLVPAGGNLEVVLRPRIERLGNKLSVYSFKKEDGVTIQEEIQIFLDADAPCLSLRALAGIAVHELRHALQARGLATMGWLPKLRKLGLRASLRAPIFLLLKWQCREETDAEFIELLVRQGMSPEICLTL